MMLVGLKFSQGDNEVLPFKSFCQRTITNHWIGTTSNLKNLHYIIFLSALGSWNWEAMTKVNEENAFGKRLNSFGETTILKHSFKLRKCVIPYYRGIYWIWNEDYGWDKLIGLLEIIYDNK